MIAKLSKRHIDRLSSFKSSSSGTATSGLASSLAFNPNQGLELIDPNKAKKMKLELDSGTQSNWFNNNDDGTFTHVKKGGGIGKPSV